MEPKILKSGTSVTAAANSYVNHLQGYSSPGITDVTYTINAPGGLAGYNPAGICATKPLPVTTLHPDDWVTNPKSGGIELRNGNSNWPTGNWQEGFVYEGAPAATDYLIKTVKFETCFPAGTLITLADKTQKTIENIRHGDIVLSHDKNGNLTPSVVDKLFTNTTDAFIRLSFADRDDLIATPGHHFLTETGDYMEIGHMARLGGGQVRIIDTDGSVITAIAERIIYSAETADMFEQAA